MDKKKILICIDWYSPGFRAGGPIRSVVNIVNALKNEFEFYILTSAYDLGVKEPYEDVITNQWFEQDGVFIKYLEKDFLKTSTIRGNIIEIAPDIIYLNSLFSKLFSIYPLIVAKRNRIKVIIAPRGMLGQGALQIKYKKKKVFIVLSKLLRLHKNITWHASTIEECEDIKKFTGKKAKISVAQNIPVSQQLDLNNILDRKKTGIIRFIFLSRITPIKNIHLAVEAVSKIKSEIPVFFDIYGNIEDPNYFLSFEHFLKEENNIKIEYKGILNPNLVSETYANADFMILPTSHENFGHAIVEAWANGCPVILSTNTPWKNLKVQNLGWDVDINDISNLIQAVQEGVDLDFTSYIQMVRASYHYFEEKICDDAVIQANRKLFLGES